MSLSAQVADPAPTPTPKPNPKNLRRPPYRGQRCEEPDDRERRCAPYGAACIFVHAYARRLSPPPRMHWTKNICRVKTHGRTHNSASVDCSRSSSDHLLHRPVWGSCGPPIHFCFGSRLHKIATESKEGSSQLSTSGKLFGRIYPQQSSRLLPHWSTCVP